MIEIKADSINDQDYSQTDLETSDPIEIYADQIKMALESELGSIMGADITMDLETYVFEMDLDQLELQTKIRDIVSNFCSFYPMFSTDISVIFTKGETRDICLVSILIDNVKKINVVIS